MKVAPFRALTQDNRFYVKSTVVCRRNEGRPIQGIDTLTRYQATLSYRSTVEMKVAPFRALTLFGTGHKLNLYRCCRNEGRPI